MSAVDPADAITIASTYVAAASSITGAPPSANSSAPAGASATIFVPGDPVVTAVVTAFCPTVVEAAVVVVGYTSAVSLQHRTLCNAVHCD